MKTQQWLLPSRSVSRSCTSHCSTSSTGATAADAHQSGSSQSPRSSHPTRDMFMKKLQLSSLARSAFLSAGLLLCAAMAHSQPYPNKPIHFVVPFPAGGPTDTSARLVAQRMQAALGQPVVVENRPGVGGIVGMQSVARAAPDGYTLILGGLTVQVLNRALYSKLPYDPEKDFTAVALLS